MFSQQKKWIIDHVPGAYYLWALLKDPISYRQLQFLRLAKKIISSNQKFQFSDFSVNDGKLFVHAPNGCKLQFVPGYPYSALMMELKEREFEQTEMAKVLELAKTAHTILDIGANCGYYSISLALTYPNLNLYAFEPVFHAHALLEQNCIYNNVTKNVQRVQKAVGNRQGKITITAAAYTSNYVVNENNSETNQPTVSIPITTVDNFVNDNNIKAVDGIKCDIEGYELFMLQGAEDVLSKFHPWLLLEIDQRWTERQGYHPIDIINFLLKKGYSYQVLSEREHKWLSQNSPETDHLLGYNFLFTFEK